MKRIVQEPLVHFIILSVAVFWLYQFVTSQRQASEHTINITRSDLERLSSLYAVEAGTLPSEEDMRALLVDQVQQEALAREARRLGLAEGDTVVQRRLAQKMTFILSDHGQIDDPGDQVLQTWFSENAARFEEPLRVSFDHVFFSNSSDPRVAKTLDMLNSSAQTDWRALGDPFMLQRHYEGTPKRELSRLFGRQFSDQLATLSNSDGSQWQGPVESALGLHLVRVTEQVEARMPQLDEVRSAVLQDWREHEQRRRTAEEISKIVDQYSIVVEGTPYP